MATITTGGNSIIIHAAGAASNTNNSRAINYRITINGVAVRGVGTFTSNSGNAEAFAIVLKKAVTAASHTIVLQWLTSANTAQIRPVAAPDTESASLLVEEVTV